MHRKLARFLIIESSFRLQLLAFVLVGMVTYFQLKVMEVQKIQLNDINDRIELVMQIPDMQELIRKKSAEAIAAEIPQEVKIPDNEFTLQGTSVEKKISYAVIDGEIYKEGDSINDYTVVKIARNSVVLENKLTNAAKRLYLFQ